MTTNALLEVVINPFGYSAIVCVCLALIGLSMMIIDVARGHARRAWSAGLLLAGIAYSAVNIVVFVVTISVDSFAIFHVAYIISMVLVLPALILIALILVARAYKRLGCLSTIGFSIWVGCMGFAHLWIIAAASAGV